MSVGNVNFSSLIEAVEEHACTYEKALIELENSATSSSNAGSVGSVNITDATVATTRVQLTQSLTEMASGIAKNAADHTKGLGRKISG